MLQYLAQGVNWLSEQMRPYNWQVATAIVATILFIYGETIHRKVRDALQLRTRPYLVRLTILITLCAFGYGAVTTAATAVVARFVATANGLILAPAALLTIILIGILADRQKHM